MEQKNASITKFTDRKDYNHVLCLSDESYLDMKKYIASTFSAKWENMEDTEKENRHKDKIIA